jgi:hypothetical protein
MFALLPLLLSFGGPGCAGVKPSTPGGSGGAGSASGGGATGGADAGRDAARVVDAQGSDRAQTGSDRTGPCVNLQCQQTTCPAGATTTLTGTVYAPNGTLPLYNALVYVPNAPVPAIPPGLACDRCGAIPPGQPVVNALTDAHGVFTLSNVPVGDQIPLVIQVGKWRRQVKVPSVLPCQENRITDRQLTRLPRNRSEGDMPRMAITTGACDNLICIISKLGIDPAEWGIAGEDKAVTFFSGGDFWGYDTVGLARFDARLNRMTEAPDLWGDLAELRKHDVAIFSCQCDEIPEDKGPAAYDAVTKYLAMGGRVFGTDYQYVWFKYSPDRNLAGFAQIQGAPLSAVAIDPPVIQLDTTFPKGKGLADWLTFVTPTLPYGKIESAVVFDNFASASQPASQIWGRSAPAEDTTRVHPRIITVNTPVGVPADQQCGRAVHLDAHISPVSAPELRSFPRDCGATLDKGEQALAFFLFDVASCVQDDSKPVVPPPVVP